MRETFVIVLDKNSLRSLQGFARRETHLVNRPPSGRISGRRVCEIVRNFAGATRTKVTNPVDRD